MTESLERTWFRLRYENTWLFLIFLGILCSILAFCQENATRMILEFRIILSSDKAPYPIPHIMWMLSSVFFALIAGAIVAYISPQAAGSGIPDMKTVLSGIAMEQHLTLRCLLATVVGLTSALGSGLSIGRQGPFVHIACALSKQLMVLLPMFNRFLANNAVKMQLLAAGCAVGVSSTFGAPIGGVLFSIEVTAMYYQVSSLWVAIFTAVAATFTAGVLHSETLSTIFSIKFTEIPNTSEITVFIFVGVISGLGGIYFINLVRMIFQFRRRLRGIWARWYVQVSVVAAGSAFVTYPLRPTLGPSIDIVQGLFSESDAPLWTNWSSNIFVNLSCFIVLKFYLTSLAVVLPIPAGVYAPVFTIGAALGRLTGEAMRVAFPSLVINAGGYSVVGAAAFSGAVTQTVSTAVIIFELTGQLDYMLPTLMATLVSTWVSRYFTYSIYDTLLTLRGLPYLATIRRHKKMQALANDVMDRNIIFLTTQSTYRDVKRVLRFHFRYFPLVDTEQNMIFLGTIPRQLLESALDYRNLPHEHIIFDDNVMTYESSKKGYVQLQDLGAPLGIDDIPLDTEENPVLDEKISLAYSHEAKAGGIITCDPSPLTLYPQTPVWKVQFLFTLMGMRHSYIVDRGKLIGVITKQMVNDLVTNK
eukprot:TRINITY_DN3679_c0_g1_i1.p1 TRINITY_DN3679_c0_g1~~TRINITY_DN3679_c0_g1_i1.p1  ORF type:complete len:644 (+),score=156.49 TRINITY_DN3679_c0_g1_i1:353-2284(+)